MDSRVPASSFRATAALELCRELGGNARTPLIAAAIFAFIVLLEHLFNKQHSVYQRAYFVLTIVIATILTIVLVVIAMVIVILMIIVIVIHVVIGTVIIGINIIVITLMMAVAVLSLVLKM